MSKWNTLDPFVQDILKTSLAGAGVFGIAHAIKLMRNQDYSLPEFGDDIDPVLLQPIYYDYTLIHALHRIYTICKRTEINNPDINKTLIDSIKLLSEFMNVTLELNNVKKSNKLIDKVNTQFSQISLKIKDAFTRSVVDQDIELVSGAISAHLHNLMMDKFV